MVKSPLKILQVCSRSSRAETSNAPCPPGQKPQNDNMGCEPCSAGSYCPDHGIERTCPEGTVSSAGAAHCTSCQAGTRANNGRTNCNNCGNGQVSYVRADQGATNKKNCFACPAGFRCPDRNAYNMLKCRKGTYRRSSDPTTACITCPAGSKCPNIDEGPVTCPDSQYSTAGSTSCLVVPAGFVKTGGGTISKCTSGQYYVPATSIAAAGCATCEVNYYCPSVTLTHIPCPPGTYSDSTGATSCTVCEAGSYCPGISAKDTCPSGTYSRAGQSKCNPCQAGYRCINTGSTDPATDPCPAGNYCPINNGVVSQETCPVSTYQPLEARTSLTDCIACPAGKICPDAANAPLDCPAGFFCPGVSFPGNNIFNLGANPDREGQARGYTDQFPCPAGSYSDVVGLFSASQCKICPEGSYCTYNDDTGRSTAVQCAQHHYCPEGHIYDNFNEQGIPCPPGTFKAEGGLHSPSQCEPCPVGQYCPAGRPENQDIRPIDCPEGTYRIQTGAMSLKDCILSSIGKTADAATGLSADATTNCPAGHYCPPGTVEGSAPKCPPGTWSDIEGLEWEYECKPCPAGNFCEEEGMTTDGTLCPAGYYCPERSITGTKHRCVDGTYRSTTGAQCQDSRIVAACTESCDNCPPGKYCDDSIPADGSDPGIITPRDCPAGHYCLAGTKYFNQYPCDNGTYSASTENESQDDCEICTDGNWCGAGVTAPEPCPPGLYYQVDPLSDRGAKKEQDCVICPAGMECPGVANGGIGNAGQPCEVGKYSKAGARECKYCIAGYFCDDVAGTAYSAMLEKRCPAGQYCFTGSKDESYDCQPGYYCPEATDQMLECLPGTYRTTPGAGQPADCGNCDAGYWCEAGMSSSPIDGKDGDAEFFMCARGHYCPDRLNPYLSETDFNVDGNVADALDRTVGSFNEFQVPCRAGTFRNALGAKSQDECATCSVGNYCPIGSPEELPCPPGYYCPEGSGFGLPCPLGTYHRSDDGVTWEPLNARTECTPCDPKMYCDGEALIEPRGPCDFGFLCFGESKVPNPNGDDIGELTGDQTGRSCPAGGYCPEGSDTVTPCEAGTYSTATRRTNADACVDCRPGTYCEVTGDVGLVEPTADCPQGYYCEQKATSGTTNECAEGTFCEEGSSVEAQCPAGTYGAAAGQGTCEACGAGEICSGTGLDAISGICPKGSYCPSPFAFEGQTYDRSYYPNVMSDIGTFVPTGILCPPGTFGDTVNMATKDDACKDCPAGQYCFNYGTTDPTVADTSYSPCDSGYICTVNSVYAQPNDHFQILENLARIGAADGTISPDDIWSSIELSALPPDYNGPCPAGYHCAEGTSLDGDVQPIKCPPGTFNPDIRGIDTDACISCYAGYACTAEGLANPDQPCTAGYFCEAGSDTPTQNQCTEGHFCPEGAAKELPCPMGYFQDLRGQAACKPCPAGKVCNEDYIADSSSDPKSCPIGFYCLGTTSDLAATNVNGFAALDGVNARCSVYKLGKVSTTTTSETDVDCMEEKYPIPCPKGTYGTGTEFETEAQCTDCLPGHYCDRVGMTETDLQTNPIPLIGRGHFSTGGATVKYPMNGTFECRGNDCGLCDVGHTCDGEGADTPGTDPYKAGFLINTENTLGGFSHI